MMEDPTIVAMMEFSKVRDAHNACTAARDTHVACWANVFAR